MKKTVIILAVFLSLVAIGLLVVKLIDTNEANKITVITGAVGGGKENFLADEDFNRILEEKYKIRLDNQNWSNNSIIRDSLVYNDGKKETEYDFAFVSDERFYKYYKQPAAEGEVPRLKVLNGSIALNTPVVFYSWVEVADKLKSEGIVEEKNGVNYITDMPKLLEYIENGKTWEEIGLPDIYGKINIASTDPVTSSPGATYYGLLASIMNKGDVDMNNVSNVLPALKDFYKYSGFLNNTPADLFDLYLRMGRGAYPIIVDYEKSIVDFANHNPKGFDQVKDKICILYSEPTIWNSHCLLTFSEKGDLFYEALKDEEIQKIAWEKYGFRTGLSGGSYDASNVPVKGIPQEIISVTQGLRKEVYDIMINELKNN